ncbi:hypothetical protein ACFQYP_08925 [Nonomuraea antimicrobica]
MTEPAEALAARIERFEQVADPGLIWDSAALSEAEQAMRACAGDRSDAATWRLIGILHLARFRLDPGTTQDAAVAGAFFAAVAVLDPGRLPEKLRGPSVPPGESAEAWAGLVEEVFRHVDPSAYRHVGLLVHALVRRAMAHPTPEVADRLGQFLLQESMHAADPSWVPGALASLGTGMVRLYEASGDRNVIDDAVHVLLRACLSAPGSATGSATGSAPGNAPHPPPADDLVTALGLAVPGDEELVRAYLAAAEPSPTAQDRSRALLALVDLTRARATATYADGDLLAFIRVGQCALDFWHERWAHPEVLAPYAAGLVEWYVVTGDERSLEAGTEMLEALRVPPDERTRGLGSDPVVRLALLGERRRHRYDVTGDPADLDAAVTALHEAVRLTPPTPTVRAGQPEEARPSGRNGCFDRAGLLTDLADALLIRAVVTGGEPAEPIAVARAALAAHGEHGPDRARPLLLLGQALTIRLVADDVDEAVAALREAASADERMEVRTRAYGLVSDVLLWRATQTEVERPAEDLHEAVLSARQAVESAMKTSGGQASAQRALCGALLARYAAQGDPRDLTEALPLIGDGDPDLLADLTTALDTPPTPGRPDSGDRRAPARPSAPADPAAADEGEPPSPDEPSAATGVGEALVPVVDEELARAATEAALRSQDEALTRKLLLVAERAAGTRAGRGEFLLGVASRLAEAGRARTAEGVLERAVQTFEAAGARSRAAYALSRLAELGDVARALAAHARSAALHHDLDDPRSEASQLARMGLLHLRNGDPGQAVEHHLRAVALCEAAGLAAEEAAHQGHAAEAYLAAGDPAGAVGCAVRSRELYLELGEPEAAALALVHAARAAVDEDDLTASAERMAACAIELEAAGAWEEACRTLDAHAVVLAGRGHPGHAAACETRLVEIVRRRGRRREPADEWYRIARRRRGRGDVDGARVAFELAEREYEAVGHDDGAGSVRYNLGVLEYAEGETERALEAFGAAGETFAGLRASAKEAAALTMRASCLTVLGRLDDAVNDLDRALELSAEEGELETLLTATLGRATVDVALGRPGPAAERLSAALTLAAGDAFKEAVVRERLAALAARTGDVGAQAEALEAALAGFRDSGQHRLAALTSIRLGFTLEARGEFRRARAALEEGLTGLEAAEDVRAGGAPFEIVAAMGGDLDGAVLSRLAAIQLTLGDVTRGRAGLTRAVSLLRGGRRRTPDAEHLETWLRLEEAEASGDLGAARTLAEQTLARTEQPGPTASREVIPLGGGSGGIDRSYLLAKLSAYCRDLGDLPAAHAYAGQGHELRDGRVVEHLCNLGAAAVGLGRAEESAGHLSEAVELSRDSESALPVRLVRSLGLLANALTDLGRWGRPRRRTRRASPWSTPPSGGRYAYRS